MIAKILQTIISFVIIAFSAANTCSGGRGSCTCDCSWANSGTCGKDDGSCCFQCCCGASPQPSPTNLTQFCPSSNDFTITYLASGGRIDIVNRGFTNYGGGGVSTKSTFNLLGGYVNYDVDVSNVRTGVNANIYTTSPHLSSASGYVPSDYCDGAASGSKFCLEVDWLESNGNCGGASTLHTIEGPGPNGCTAWGCSANYHYNGRTSFHMRINYGKDGSWTTIRDGITITGSGLSPTPSSKDWGIIASDYTSKGALIYSSMWTGWVPVEDCGTSGDLHSSTFSIRNLQIYGSVVQGPQPTKC